MTRPQTPAVALAERLCRPQRVGVFGHRGAGKTTLLTMLYREGVGGRLPGLRLAAADARTATYLSDKVVQLEAGQALPATLGETELRFHLYHGPDCRLDLVVMDYQGEHVRLGRQEPIRDFLRGCDAVWLCLDVPVAATPAACLEAQQEVEQLVEDYLSAEDPTVPQRPMALLLTKADLLGPDADPAALADRHFGMTRHALASHCPTHGVFAVSSLGGPLPEAPAEPVVLGPSGLAGPLTWLAEALRAQDEARLHRLWELAPGDLAALGRAVATFARRYPDAPATKAFRARLSEARRRRLTRRALAAVAAAAALFVGVWGYDTAGAQGVQRFAAAHADDPGAVRQRWREYQAWHPTRHLLRPAAARAEREALAALDREVRDRERGLRLADLRRQADDPDADPEVVWAEFGRFRTDFPEHDVDEDWRLFRDRLKARSDARRAQRERDARAQKERRAELAFLELERAGRHASLDGRVELAARFLREHAGTAREAEVRSRHDASRARQQEALYEAARDYSTRYPRNFYTRLQRYQQYLDRYPDGAYASAARSAQGVVRAEWDKHLFRAVRDHYQSKPGEVAELKRLCREYLAADTEGHFRYRASARELLNWADRVSVTGEYRVTLKSGSFDKKAAHMVSRGPSLSVEVEVNGVRHGPSTIVPRSYEPEWDYAFPRPVRWKLGDTVKVYVTDNYYWRRHVIWFDTQEGDKLAMRMLSGELAAGTARLTFESDFAMPKVPKVD